MTNNSYGITKCTSEIKNDKTKKLPYVQIVAALIIFGFLIISLGSQIASYSKDLAENSYVEYTGAATITTRKQIIFGCIPTGYIEYAISFEYEGRNVELYTRKKPDLIGDVNEVIIVYATNSNYIIAFDIIQ